MKPTVVYPDSIDRCRVLLTELLAPEISADSITVAVGVPTGWTSADPMHVELDSDGPDVLNLHPVAARTPVRVVVHGTDPTPTAALAQVAMGRLLGSSGVNRRTGVLVARDPDTGAQLASFTVWVTGRAQLVSTGT